MRDLTTTSYALLGLLALKPWTTYELAQQMNRSMRHFWPRAQSKLYEEPKNLVAHGLATAKRERVGSRPRTVYDITPEGREALRSWLDKPGARATLEFEAILKVFFGDQGSKEELRAQVRNIRDQAMADQEEAIRFLEEYLETGGPFPERLGIISVMMGFLTGQARSTLEWANWAEGEIEQWENTHAPPNQGTLLRLLERSRSDVGGD